ncbi:MAG TPA: O-antigen ligase family protein [Anaerolineaceae bacterium]|nr:O-antigen ligase family protein [Anaerolineaceae bacterium]
MISFRNLASDRGQKRLPVWLLAAFGALWGGTAAFLLIQQQWIPLLALIAFVPVAVLFWVYPFIVVHIWLLFFPFFIIDVLPDARKVYWLLHRAMIPLALVALSLMAITRLRKDLHYRPGLVDWMMAAYVLFSVVNILLMSAQPVAELIRYYDRIFVPFCMYWLIRLLAPGWKEIRSLAPTAIVIVVSQGIIGLLSWFKPGLLPAGWLGRFGERTTGTFGNPGVFTTTILFCVVILALAGLQAPRRAIWQQAGTWIVIGAAFFFVFFSFSRGSWLGAVPIAVGLFLLYPKRVATLALIGSFLIVPLLAISPLRNFSSFAAERLTTQTTAEGRVIGGAATARMIAEKPVFGWGYGNHELYDEQFRDPSVLGLAANKEKSSHNTYLLIAAEMGLSGLFLYYLPSFWLLYLSIKYAGWLPRLPIDTRLILLMFWLLLLDHFFVGLFTDMIQSNLFNTVIWWLALGWIANLVDAGRRTAHQFEEYRSIQGEIHDYAR